MNAMIKKIEQLEDKLRKAVGEDKLPRGLENAEDNYDSKKFFKLAKDIRKMYPKNEQCAYSSKR